jgi:hypothetical protein
MMKDNWWVYVSILKELQNPYEYIAWEGVTRPISDTDVTYAIKYGNFIKDRSDQVMDDIYHAGRIAYFVKNPWRSLIYATILPTNNGGVTEKPVWDGLHRLSAAIYRGDNLIHVCVDGDLDLASKILLPAG